MWVWVSLVSETLSGLKAIFFLADFKHVRRGGSEERGGGGRGGGRGGGTRERRGGKRVWQSNVIV